MVPLLNTGFWCDPTEKELFEFDIGSSAITNNNRLIEHFDGIGCIGCSCIYHYLVTAWRKFCYIELCIIYIFHGEGIIGMCFYVE